MARQFKNVRALVVDDYDNMRKKLTTVLEKLGISITEAANGVEGMEILRNQKFDILFTDIVMPEMDGFELCEEIRKQPELRGLPIVVTSTHCDSNYIIKALRYGADDYISKPIEVDLVEKVITRILPSASEDSSNG